MDRGAWWAAVHGITKSQPLLSDFTFTFHFHALEKEMATHSSILTGRIPWTEEPGENIVESMGRGFQRVNSLHEVAKVLEPHPGTAPS